MSLKLVEIANGSSPQSPSGSNVDDLAIAAAQLREEFDMRMAIQKGRMWLQDLWFLTYLLVDASQTKTQDSDADRPQYYTSKAMSIVDTARRVLAKNPLRYHVLEPNTGTTRELREDSRVTENIYHGVMYDIDRQMVRRGEGNARMVAAFHALVRGQWAYKMHLTQAEKTSTGSPIHYQQLDPRLVLPSPDLAGMQSVIAYNLVTLAQLYDQYPEIIPPITKSILASSSAWTGKKDMSFLHQPILQIEWSSRDEHAIMVDLSSLPTAFTKNLGITEDSHSGRRYVWLREPWSHGFDHSMIQMGNVNGVPAGLASTEASTLFHHYSQGLGGMGTGGLTPVANADGMNAVTITGQRVSPQIASGSNAMFSMSGQTIDPAGSMMGRSILAPVAHLFPQFNDLMVLLKQGVQNEIRGTWTHTSRGGQMPQGISLGDGKINPLSFNERLENVQPNIRAIDVQQVMAQVQQDINEGSLDLRFVLGSDFEGSGFVRQQMEKGALTSVTDYEMGLSNWGISVAETFNAQYRAGAEHLKDFKLYGRQPGAQTAFFVIDIDDKVKEKLTSSEEPLVIDAKTKVDIPIDMAARINMAKTAIDPNNPVMSLVQAIDLILEMDDADQAYDRILMDIGRRNPTLQLVTIANAFREAGANDLADMILGDQFRDAFANDVAQGSTLTNKGAAQGTDPNAAPPEVTTGDGGVGTGQPSPTGGQ